MYWILSLVFCSCQLLSYGETIGGMNSILPDLSQDWSIMADNVSDTLFSNATAGDPFGLMNLAHYFATKMQAMDSKDVGKRDTPRDGAIRMPLSDIPFGIANYKSDRHSSDNYQERPADRSPELRDRNSYASHDKDGKYLRDEKRMDDGYKKTYNGDRPWKEESSRSNDKTDDSKDDEPGLSSKKLDGDDDDENSKQYDSDRSRSNDRTKNIESRPPWQEDSKRYNDDRWQNDSKRDGDRGDDAPLQEKKYFDKRRPKQEDRSSWQYDTKRFNDNKDSRKDGGLTGENDARKMNTDSKYNYEDSRREEYDEVSNKTEYQTMNSTATEETSQSKNDRNYGKSGKEPRRGRFIHRIIIRNKAVCPPLCCPPQICPECHQPYCPAPSAAIRHRISPYCFG